jgi:hypothetical protein
MTSLGPISTGILLLLLGSAGPTYAQQDRPDQNARPKQQEPQGTPDKPPQQTKDRHRGQTRHQAKPREHPDEGKGQQGKDQQRQGQGQGQGQEQAQQPPGKPRPQEQTSGQQQRRPEQQTKPEQRKQQANRPVQQPQRVEQGEQRGVWQQHRAHSWQSEHRTWQQRGGYNGYRIPEDHFRGYFGRDHWFRVYSAPMVIMGRYPRFQYGGYWFRLVDPWPEDWSDNWYEDDDVYIDYYEDGYYMYNRHHPGVRIAVKIYIN